MDIRSYIPYYKRNLRLAFPVMLTQLGGAIIGIVDSVMVGHYSTTDLAAVSFANGIFFTFMVFAMGAMMGITPLVGQLYVQHEHSQIRRLLHNGLVFCLLLTIVTCSVLVVFIPLMDDMGQEPSVAAAALPYFVTRVVGLTPFMLFCLFKQFMEGLGNTTIAMLISVVLNLLNVVLNWVFIYGHCGLPAMGAFGAGLASLIATILMPLIFLTAMFSKAEWRQYLRGFSLRNISRNLLRQLAKVGFPIGMQTTMETILFTLSFIMVGWISKEALAAHHIANQIADLTFMLALGIGAATTIRVSHQYGLRDYHAMQMAARASIHLVLMMNTIGASLMIGLRHYIPYLFTNDPQVIDIAADLLVFAGLFQYSDGLQCVGAAMLRGITDVRRPMIYAFVAYVVIALPLGYLLMFPLGLGVKGMWISFIIALSLAAASFHLRFRNKRIC